jgi:hypothetical protein
VLVDPNTEEWLRSLAGNRARAAGNPGLGGAAENRNAPANENPARESLMNRLLERFDKNKDGKLDEAERREAMRAIQGRQDN